MEWYDFFLYGAATALIFNQLYFPSVDPLLGTLSAHGLLRRQRTPSRSRMRLSWLNKLTLIMRSMYGRGRFDLLRQRVLYASAA